MASFSNSLTSARWADGFENYFQYLLLQFFVPLIIGLLCTFIFSIIYIHYKKYKDIQKMKYGIVYIGVILLLFIVAMSPVLIYSVPEYAADFKFHANDAWDYKNTMVKNLTAFNNVLDVFIDDIFCVDNCALNNTIGKDVTKPLQKVIEILNDYFPEDSIEVAKKIFKKAELAIYIIQISVTLFVCFGSIFFLSSFLLDQSKKEKFRTKIFCFSIIISSLALLTSIAFLLASVLVSDGCNDYITIASNYIDDANLIFYLTCDPNSNNATDEFPPFLFKDNILNIVRDDYDLVNLTGAICNFENKTHNSSLGNSNNLNAAKVFKKLELIFNLNLPADKTGCQNCQCNPDVADTILNMIGNYTQHTGLYGLLECGPAHNRLSEIQSSVCSFFSPLVAFFVMFMSLSGHLLFAFYFKV